MTQARWLELTVHFADGTSHVHRSAPDTPETRQLLDKEAAQLIARPAIKRVSVDPVLWPPTPEKPERPSPSTPEAPAGIPDVDRIIAGAIRDAVEDASHPTPFDIALSIAFALQAHDPEFNVDLFMSRTGTLTRWKKESAPAVNDDTGEDSA